MSIFSCLEQSDFSGFKYDYNPETDLFLFKPWYNGRWVENESAFRLSDGRFSLKNRPVCYLATDLSLRMNYEVNRCFESEKKDNKSVAFEVANKQFINNSFPHTKTYYLDCSNIELFDFTSVQIANQLSRQTTLETQFFSLLINCRCVEAYDLSSLFSEIIEKKGFDGIIYQPCTQLATDCLGPQNDPMVVLFNCEHLGGEPLHK